MVELSTGPQREPLSIFPLNTVLFPGMRLPLHVFEDRYRSMIDDCLNRDRPFGVTLIQHGAEVGGPAEPNLVGTTARIVHVQRLHKGRMHVQVVGEQRFRLLELLERQPYLVASVALYDERDCPAAPDYGELVATAYQMYLEYARVLKEVLPETDIPTQTSTAPRILANFIAAHLDTLSLPVRQSLLEIFDVGRLLEHEIDWLDHENRRLRISLLARYKIQELEAEFGERLKNKRWLN